MVQGWLLCEGTNSGLAASQVWTEEIEQLFFFFSVARDTFWMHSNEIRKSEREYL
ncbi:hypothetical protein M406DRAFT_321734 [Cryphonectria parasitica EP155]|uniref:Uncharacterized protein n=1 Tax=Cryphonectria parasitica (strain ATCC 38755 / EP155) TaxID=660469 RepID=A0A9P4Y770_CRYP1|nr:uncharacterized protein M406DRAFT_321734 [Cryphonectria parasitica EP155]KAF3767813.1 hypothetical protein M406DRAFT_321734 [Cryphonectria parasitica EP155]